MGQVPLDSACVRVVGHLSDFTHLRSSWTPWIIAGCYSESVSPHQSLRKVHTIPDLDLNGRVTLCDILDAPYDLRHGCDGQRLWCKADASRIRDRSIG